MIIKIRVHREGSMVCGNCNLEVPNGARHCPHCGKPIGRKVCQNCGAKLTTECKYCPKCGFEIASFPSNPIPNKPRWGAIVEKKGFWFSWRRVGAILTLLLYLLLVFIATVSGSDSEGFSFLHVFLVVQLFRGVIGLKTKSKAPAWILILTITILFIVTLVSVYKGNAYNSYYDIRQGLPFDCGKMGYDGFFLLFTMLYILAFMMLVTPRKFREEESPINDVILGSS